MSRRVVDHPVLGQIKDNEQVSFTFNEKKYHGMKGEPIAAAILANGVRTLRHHEEKATPRGIYCNIGHCFECRVTVDGKQGVRSCLTPLESGMVIESSGQLPNPVRGWRSNHE